MYTDEYLDKPFHVDDCRHSADQYVGTIGWLDRTTREKQMLDIYVFPNFSGNSHVCVRHGENEKYMSMPLLELLKCRDYDDPAYAVSRFLQDKGKVLWSRGTTVVPPGHVVVSVAQMRVLAQRCQSLVNDEIETLLNRCGHWDE